MQILNIAGYKFTDLANLDSLRDSLLHQGDSLGLKGTILLSDEGVNINLAGKKESINIFKHFLATLDDFSNIRFHETYSDSVPFKHFKIKVKNEIITLREPGAIPAINKRAPIISPEELKNWLDENRDITLLDTRNDYEFRFGTFKNAINLHIKNFGELPEAVGDIDHDKPIVMFCTGGIRCEKAALHMLQDGFKEVYQLDGGILGYFAKVGGAHYVGECFVFDERIALDTNLCNTDTIQCKVCQGPMKASTGCPEGCRWEE